jgi:hypothetical protein
VISQVNVYRNADALRFARGSGDSLRLIVSDLANPVSRGSSSPLPQRLRPAATVGAYCGAEYMLDTWLLIRRSMVPATKSNSELAGLD